MVKYKTDKARQSQLDDVFGALANNQRRAMVAMLTQQSRSISELARPLGLSLPAIHKHIKVLERAQLIDRHKVGRSSEVVLRVRALAEAEAWIEEHRAFWSQQLDSLEKYVDELNERKRDGTHN